MKNDNTAMKQQRAATQATLGSLIDELSKLPPTFLIDAIGRPHSYRGYYSDLAFERYSNSPKMTVWAALGMLNGCLGAKFMGYKGGSYTMGRDTPVWIANYGCCGLKIMGLNADGTFHHAGGRMNLNELADAIDSFFVSADQDHRDKLRREAAAILRAAAEEQIGSEWKPDCTSLINTGPHYLHCFSVEAGVDSVREEACTRHNADIAAARVAVAAARKELVDLQATVLRENEEASSVLSRITRERDEALARVAELEQRMRERAAMTANHSEAPKGSPVPGADTAAVSALRESMKKASEIVKDWPDWDQRHKMRSVVAVDLRAVTEAAQAEPQPSILPRGGAKTVSLAEARDIAIEQVATAEADRKAAVSAEAEGLPRQWSSELPPQQIGKWWNAWSNTDGSCGVWLIPGDFDWQDAILQRASYYDLWLPYIEGDTKDTLPPLPNQQSSHVSTRELVAALARLVQLALNKSMPQGCCHSLSADIENIITEARKGEA